MPLDKRDRSILDVLKEDSRLPIRDIAKRSGLRPSTVHDRMLKMKKEGIIERYTVKLDDTAMEESFIVIMLVKTKPSEIFDQSLLNHKHVKEAFGITGEYDIMLKLKFRDVQDFNEFIIRFRKDNRVLSTMTMVATASIKEEI